MGKSGNSKVKYDLKCTELIPSGETNLNINDLDEGGLGKLSYFCRKDLEIVGIN